MLSFSGLTDTQRRHVVGVYDYLAEGLPPDSDFPVACFVPGARFDVRAPFSVAGMRFDPRVSRGIGATGYNENIGYLGFCAWMTPSTFLDLNVRRRQREGDFISNAVEDGYPFGPPMLLLEVSAGSPASMRVYGHEGRGRMMWMEEHSPAALIPVAMKPHGHWRARSFTPEMLLGARVMPDLEGGLSSARITRITLEGVNHALPGLGEAPCIP